jgi:YegS/Rv2252/BmrU family lipid kinase
MSSKWFAIVNPISGRGKSLQELHKLQQLFIKYNTEVIFQVTSFAHQEQILVQNAIERGFTKIISIGGDGTLHHIVNGIMSQQHVATSKIIVAVIPFGTGNDWVKTYKIPKHKKEVVQYICNEKTIFQDIGSAKTLSDNKITFFNNVAGIGFDAFVVHKIASLKAFGAIAYLLGAILSFFSYSPSKVKVTLGEHVIELPLFMLNVGICQFSGGGMQLTAYKNHKNGFFDVTLMRNIKLSKVLLQINYLFNGNLKHFKEVETFQPKQIKVEIKEELKPFIQADGEIIGSGDVVFDMHPAAIQFVIP